MRHNVNSRIEFLNVDMANFLESGFAHARPFAMMISNPPYIPTAEIDKLQTEISKYEPRSALDGGVDGMDFYRKISERAKNYLNKDGRLIFEIGFGQSDRIRDILLRNGFGLFKTIKDYSGIERVLVFQFLV